MVTDVPILCPFPELTLNPEFFIYRRDKELLVCKPYHSIELGLLVSKQPLKSAIADGGEPVEVTLGIARQVALELPVVDGEQVTCLWLYHEQKAVRLDLSEDLGW